MNMFCYQCEQTAKCEGCTSFGVCGKDPETAAVQDLLVYAVKYICRYMHRAYELGGRDSEVDHFINAAMFSTLTNVNFDPERFKDYMGQAVEMKKRARRLYEKSEHGAGNKPKVLDSQVAWWEGIDDINEMIRKGESVTIANRIDELGEDITSLQELLTYGIKGYCSYAYHAELLGKEDETIYEFTYRALDYLTRRPVSQDELLGLCLECGKINLRAMEILDAAHTGRYGHPEPTSVRTTPVKGKCIAVSGHDLLDLEEILKQTEGTGINVYTHGEMLACNGYPELKKYNHLVGNYGGAWQNQRQEFEEFPGAVFMTTNCLQKPKDSYKHRIFTGGVVGWEGVQHIENRDFSPLIEAALAEEGFAKDEPAHHTITGCAHNAVLGMADKVVNAVKEGKIRHFFLIGGCDGAKPGRNYFTDLAQAVPEDCVILTLACGKYRFNKLEFGEIGGIPRLLDCGQCNDAYSAIKIATGLSEAFDCDVNELPLSFVVSWFEQKAVAILLTLLYLNVQNIKLGPTLPAFVSSNVLDVLVENYNVAPIGSVEEDLAGMLK